MGIYLKPFGYFLLSIIFCVCPMMLVGQTAQQKSTQIQQKNRLTFSQGMNQSAQELKWSHTYYQSFKKTQTASYLKLAATHCANAIKLLETTQAMFPNTTRFYYKAKNKRFAVCQFYGKLQETALRLAPEYHIEDIANHSCKF